MPGFRSGAGRALAGAFFLILVGVLATPPAHAQTGTGATLTLDPPNIREDGGRQTVTATATLVGDAPSTLATLNISWNNLTASDSDAPEATYPATVTFAVGVSEVTFTLSLTPFDDTEKEGDEEISFGIAGFVDGTFRAANDTLTILDDDSTPSFGASGIPDQFYAEDRRISALTLPAAMGGDGTLRYSLSPPPGLSFDAATQRLTGTPTALQEARTYSYTASGLVTWDLDSETAPDRLESYHVDWAGDVLAPSRIPNYAGYASVREHVCADAGGGRCQPTPPLIPIQPQQPTLRSTK